MIRASFYSLCLVLTVAASRADLLAPVPTPTNIVVRLMAANLTGNSQTYEPPQIRILQGLKPDVVAIQEFRYGNNTPADIRAFVDTAFGTGFAYFRENYVAAGDIPNGVISRFPITDSGSWDDPDMANRGFAWARIDLPGTNDLYVVSVHFKASSGSAESAMRAREATNVVNHILTNFPAGTLIVVAGDLNTQSPSEICLAHLKTLLRDDPIPTDAESAGDADTNAPRNERYDYVLPNPVLWSNQVPTRVGNRSFPNGLVFDSGLYAPLTDVAPVLSGDSASGQHMAVVKDFRIDFVVTNLVTVTPPMLVLRSTNQVTWTGPSNLTYSVQSSTLVTNWVAAGTATSPTTNFSFTFPDAGAPQRFYRVTYP